MKKRIGIISSDRSNYKYKCLEKKFSQQCIFKYYYFDNLKEVDEIVINNKNQVDAYIFSGYLPYIAAEKSIKEIVIPVNYFEIDIPDVYKSIIKAYQTVDNLNLSKVFFDFILDVTEYNITNVLKNDEKPLTRKDVVLDDNMSKEIESMWENNNFGKTFNENYYDYIYKKHNKLWKQGRIELSFTRTRHIVNRLQEDGLIVIYVEPFEDTLISKVEKVIDKITLNKKDGNQLVIANVTIKNLIPNISNKIKILKLKGSLENYVRNSEYSLFIQDNIFGFEISTSKEILTKLTNNYSECDLFEYLDNKLDFSFSIGWGIGFSIENARINAEKANKYAYNQASSCSFIVLENGNTIGPIGKKSQIELINNENDHIIQLSEKYDLPYKRVLQLIKILRNKNTAKITSQELSNELEITLRSANRILNDLVDKKAAIILEEKKCLGRGRPKKIYKLIWDK